MRASDELTADLAGVVDAVCAADPTALADGEAIVALHRQLDRLEAATTRASAAFDAGRSWDDDGARSAASWIAVRCNQPVRSARQRVRLGRELRHMAAVEEAWLAGDIGVAHVASLARARSPVTEACFARDEEQLVLHAVNRTYRGFVRALAHWSQLADPDGVENAAEAALVARRLHLSESFEGQWFLDGVLDPIGGAVVAKALKKIDDELFEIDWSEARDSVCFHELCDIPADDCEIDHIEAWADGGLTVEANGRAACGAPQSQPPSTKVAAGPPRAAAILTFP